MNLIIYVHDFHPQIGHSRAMIELVNGLNLEQKNQIQQIEIVSFTSSDLNQVFPDIKNKKLSLVPFPKLKPFIIKMFIYHIYSFIHAILADKKSIKIGIGIASLNVDITNIQFIHQQWEPIFFNQRKLNLISLIYKKILFLYFSFAEDYLFKKPKLQFIVIANFISKYIQNNFEVNKENIHFIPSAVNPEEFKISQENQLKTFQLLTNEYPQLAKIDPKLPIAIFAGAFERKGLDKALSYLQQFPGTQFIIIGKPELESNWIFPENITIVRIEFTKKINLFYEISDLFIFPTYYEPFGLVIIEAYAMGLDLIIPKDNVGASEFIENLPGIYFFNQNENIPTYEFRKFSIEEKLLRRSERLKNLKNITWAEGAKTFYKILEKTKSLK